MAEADIEHKVFELFRSGRDTDQIASEVFRDRKYEATAGRIINKKLGQKVQSQSHRNRQS